MSLLRISVLLVVVAVLVPGNTSAFAAGPTADALGAVGASEVQDVFVRPPQNAPSGHPLQVVIALHGMGGNGPDFGSALTSQADRYGWLIVAPTIQYGDWTDPLQISREDPALVAWLSDEIRNLSDRTGYVVLPKVLLFGHSRGAQLSLRFAEVSPEQVAGVAAVSAGTYTLPLAEDGRGHVLDFPFGIADLDRDDGGRAFDQTAFNAVPLWLGVGGADNNPADVPAAWSPYIGSNRLARAETFAQTLQSQGGDVSLEVFPNVDHTLTDDMRQAGTAALEADLGR
ncbi:MAG: hypothetical protein JO352_20970 [Chloroflexi bacterium]|nr:hypothetical protein [Chloroflexota bacterium]MBV9603163.1 hypothetical protein [Chloroflexota bacterium]